MDMETLNGIFGITALFTGIVVQADAAATFRGIDVGLEEGNKFMRGTVHWVHESGLQLPFHLFLAGLVVAAYFYCTFAVAQFQWMSKPGITIGLIFVFAIVGLAGIARVQAWNRLIDEATKF